MHLKALIGRDYRNPHHVLTAHQIIVGHAGLRVLPATMAEMQRVGLPLPSNAKVQKVIRKGNIAIGAAFLLELGLYYADNMITQCNDCRAPIQFRPSLGHSVATPVCIFCAAQRLLNEQADKKSKKKR